MLDSGLHQLIRTFRTRDTSPRVLVVGDAMLDVYLHDEPDTLDGTKCFLAKNTQYVPGGAANVAANAVALGCQTTLIAATGADVEGDLLENVLTAAGVTTRLLRFHDHLTTIKTRCVSGTRILERHDREVRLPATMASALMRRFSEEVSSADIVILSDYMKGTLPDSAAWIRLCHRNGTPILIDSKNPDADCRGADLSTPNLDEACILLGRSLDARSLADHATALLARLGTRAVLATLGADGMLLIQPNRRLMKLPAFGDGVDPTGAGDTVIAAVAAALAIGANLEDAMLYAAYAAALVVARPGTAVASVDELASIIDEESRVKSWRC